MRAIRRLQVGIRAQSPEFRVLRYEFGVCSCASCITQLEAQGPSRDCNESKDEEKRHVPGSERWSFWQQCRQQCLACSLSLSMSLSLALSLSLSLSLGVYRGARDGAFGSNVAKGPLCRFREAPRLVPLLKLDINFNVCTHDQP